MRKDMKPYSLKFRCYGKEKDGEVVDNTRLFTTEIFAQNFEGASVMALAMLGGEIDVREFLGEVISVGETRRKPGQFWGNVEYIWEHVLNRLGLALDEVEFFPSESDKRGIIFKRSPPQLTQYT